MNNHEMRAWMIDRTTKFGVDIVNFCKRFSGRSDCRKVIDQLLDSGTSTAANYRAALRGRSRPDYISKIGVANEESDETVYWLTDLLMSRFFEIDRWEIGGSPVWQLHRQRESAVPPLFRNLKITKFTGRGGAKQTDSPP
jgi:four helix bundle protein